MPEFVVEKTKGDVIIVAGKRASRPHIFGKKVDLCPFDAGSEKHTPPTTFALPAENDWRVRCFENGFPFLQRKGKFAALTKNNPTPAFGDHEVIVESDRHEEEFQDFSTDQVRLCFSAYEHREKEFYARKGTKYVLLFKNHGKAAGASIDHEHSQIISLPFVPPVVAAEEKACRKKCVFCELLKKEKENELFENDYFVAVRPSFARFPYEFWLVSKKHVGGFRDFDEAMADEFCVALKKCAKTALKVSESYNFLYHAAPPKGKLHFHVEVVPRTNNWAGAELGGGIIVNSKEASQAIEELR